MQRTAGQGLLDVVHSVGLLTLFGFTTFGVYDAVTTLKNRRKQKDQWLVLNPTWEDDPYLAFHPSWMRFTKASEEQIILTRPQYYAAKRLRELEGYSFQPPYEYLPEGSRKGGLPAVKDERGDFRGDDHPIAQDDVISNDPNQIKAQMAVFEAHKTAHNVQGGSV